MDHNGELIEGEEDLLKIIVKWDDIPGAEGYELCHECNHIDESTGAEIGAVDGTIYPAGIVGRDRCGGRPCKVMPGAPMGYNKYHLRVKNGGKFSPWSNHQNFETLEEGSYDHTEL